MHRAGRWHAILLAAIILGGLLVPRAGRAASAGDPTRGKAHFKEYCTVCHGTSGLGDGPMAKVTSPPTPKLTSSEIRNKTDQDLLAVIANGKNTAMPAWRGLLTDQDLLDVVVYVRALGD
jgi:mono/diheme cytochrome c family protein